MVIVVMCVDHQDPRDCNPGCVFEQRGVHQKGVPGVLRTHGVVTISLLALVEELSRWGEVLEKMRRRRKPGPKPKIKLI